MSALALLDSVGGWCEVVGAGCGLVTLESTTSGDTRGGHGGLGHGAAGRESNFLEPLLVAFTPVKLPIDFLSEKPTD